MIVELLEMGILGFIIGLTGALAPGPTLIATINASLKRGWLAGPWVTLGHMAVELVMALFVLAGLSILVGGYTWIIAGVGGGALAIFGVLTLLESRHARIDVTDDTKNSGSPFLAGVVTSISNPYFWLWWFTVGSALLIGAFKGGILPALAFIAGHWAADLGWLTLVSAGVHKGKFILGEKEYRLTLAACGVFLICFGGYYIVTFWEQFR